MGDYNVNDHRLKIIPNPDDPTLSKTERIPARPQRLEQYRLFTGSLAGDYTHHFKGPTHRPYQKDIDTVAQLDYLISIDTLPTLVTHCKSAVTLSDHDCLFADVYPRNDVLDDDSPEFVPFSQYMDTDFGYVDGALQSISASLDWQNDTDYNLVYLQCMRANLLDAASRNVMKTRPKRKKAKELSLIHI